MEGLGLRVSFHCDILAQVPWPKIALLLFSGLVEGPLELFWVEGLPNIMTTPGIHKAVHTSAKILHPGAWSDFPRRMNSLIDMGREFMGLSVWGHAHGWMLDASSRGGSRTHCESTSSLGGFPCCWRPLWAPFAPHGGVGMLRWGFHPPPCWEAQQPSPAGPRWDPRGPPLCGVEDLARWREPVYGFSDEVQSRKWSGEGWVHPPSCAGGRWSGWRDHPSAMCCVSTPVFFRVPSLLMPLVWWMQGGLEFCAVCGESDEDVWDLWPVGSQEDRQWYKWSFWLCCSWGFMRCPCQGPWRLEAAVLDPQLFACQCHCHGGQRWALCFGSRRGSFGLWDQPHLGASSQGERVQREVPFAGRRRFCVCVSEHLWSAFCRRRLSGHGMGKSPCLGRRATGSGSGRSRTIFIRLPLSDQQAWPPQVACGAHWTGAVVYIEEGAPQLPSSRGGASDDGTLGGSDHWATSVGQWELAPPFGKLVGCKRVSEVQAHFIVHPHQVDAV